MKKIISWLAEDWLHAKRMEREFTERRRLIEDNIKEAYNIGDSFSGTETIELDGLKIKISCRVDRKVDGDKLQEIAAENGLEGMLSDLFRWKPEVNVKAWLSSDQELVKPLSDAITVKPGRASFSITAEETE